MRTLLLGTSFALLSVALWPTPYALAADAMVARGTVVALSASSLSVKVRDQEMKFAVDPKTIVEARGAGTKTRAAKAGGKAGVSLAEVLKPGQSVAVTYHDMNGVFHASLVRAIPSAGDGDLVKADDPESSIGTVQSIGSNGMTLKGARNGATFTQTFVIDEHTEVFAKGAGTAAKAKGGRLPVTDIVGAGDQVNVSYRKAGDHLVAAVVRVTAKRAH